MPKLGADHGHALELLAGSPNGCTEPRMVARRITRAVLPELIWPASRARTWSGCLPAPMRSASGSRRRAEQA
jgi:hypothetical protein